MPRVSLLTLPFLAVSLSACGDGDIQSPRQVCSERGPEKYVYSRGGGYRYSDCVRYEIRCLAPLKLLNGRTASLFAALIRGKSMTKVTAAAIKAALRRSYSEPEWAILFEVGDATGARHTRFADAVVMSLWPSRGLTVTGMEIKVSRSDGTRNVRSRRRPKLSPPSAITGHWLQVRALSKTLAKYRPRGAGSNTTVRALLRGRHHSEPMQSRLHANFLLPSFAVRRKPIKRKLKTK